MANLIKPASRQTPALKKGNIVRFTDRVMRDIIATIGAHPPETFGLLGGRLDDPFLVTDFRFCPPRRGRDGRFDRSGGHVNVDAEYMNFVIDEEWRPNGKYMLGIIHSHPYGCRQLSSGSEATNEGDLVFFRNCLLHDDSPGRNWRYAIAPIMTFDGTATPLIDVWVVTLDGDPMPASLKVVPDVARPFDESDSTSEQSGLPVKAISGRVDRYLEAIEQLNQIPIANEADKEAIVGSFRKLMLRELRDIERGVHPLGSYLSTNFLRSPP